jgi:hypothetical protein
MRRRGFGRITSPAGYFIKRGRLVLTAVPAGGVGWREGREEMPVQFGGRGRGEAALARQGRSGLQVHEPVGSRVIVWGEYLKEMVGHRFASGLGEAAGASRVSHFVTFHFIAIGSHYPARLRWRRCGTCPGTHAGHWPHHHE